MGPVEVAEKPGLGLGCASPKDAGYCWLGSPCWAEATDHLFFFIHKYVSIYVHTCKCNICPVTNRFLFLSSNLSCAIQPTCAMFKARLKNKTLACYKEQSYGFSNTREGEILQSRDDRLEDF